MAESAVVRALGWALLHFIWQGVLLAGLAGLAMDVLRGRSPQIRYVVGCAALLLMVMAPVATCFAGYTPAQVILAGPSPGGGTERQAVLAPLAEVALEVRSGEVWRDRVEGALPSMVAVWVAGILGLSVRLVGGWGYAQRLTRREVRPAAAVLQQRLELLARRLELSRPVRLLESARVRVPTVVGWLRPVVLLPFAAAAGLTPAQMEAVLLHELAHVRRHDYLVNLIQSGVEVLLFYHPGVWWVSQRVREEREACCDDLAVAACGDALVYARALTQLEGLRSAAPRLAMAADGGSLLHRVRRLVLPAPQRTRGPASLLPPLLFVTLMAAAAQRALFAPVEERALPGKSPLIDAGGLPAARLEVSPSASRSDAADLLPGVAASHAPADVPGGRAAVRRARGTQNPRGSAAARPENDSLIVRLRRIAAEGRGSDEKVRLLVEMSAAVTADSETLDLYLNVASTISSPAGRRAALAAVVGSAPVLPRPERVVAAARVPVRRTPPVTTPPHARGRAPVQGADSSLATRLAQAEAIDSPSARREALSALVREQIAPLQITTRS